MEKKTDNIIKKIVIIGFGGVGRGVLLGIGKNTDMKCVGIVTRRPQAVKVEVQDRVPVYGIDEEILEDPDCAILCTKSATDLFEQKQGVKFLERFKSTVDSFDDHRDIYTYQQSMDVVAKKNNHTSIVSAGWDPGIFSIERVIAQAFLLDGKGYTFYGPGVSRGHTTEVKDIMGVIDAIQYTIPIESSIELIRSGKTPDLTTKQMHKRLVYVVAEMDDEERIVKEIKQMPKYFAPYNVEVKFITQEEMNKDHSNNPHGGFVLTSGLQDGKKQTIERVLQLGNNSNFTAGVLLATARATCRLYESGKYGAFTMLDFPLGLLSPYSAEELRKNFI